MRWEVRRHARLPVTGRPALPPAWSPHSTLTGPTACQGCRSRYPCTGSLSQFLRLSRGVLTWLLDCPLTKYKMHFITVFRALLWIKFPQVQPLGSLTATYNTLYWEEGCVASTTLLPGKGLEELQAAPWAWWLRHSMKHQDTHSWLRHSVKHQDTHSYPAPQHSCEGGGIPLSQGQQPGVRQVKEFGQGAWQKVMVRSQCSLG